MSSDGTTSWWPAAEHRCHLCAISETGTQSAARYRGAVPMRQWRVKSFLQMTISQTLDKCLTLIYTECSGWRRCRTTLTPTDSHGLKQSTWPRTDHSEQANYVFFTIIIFISTLSPGMSNDMWDTAGDQCQKSIQRVRAKCEVPKRTQRPESKT